IWANRVISSEKPLQASRILEEISTGERIVLAEAMVNFYAEASFILSLRLDRGHSAIHWNRVIDRCAQELSCPQPVRGGCQITGRQRVVHRWKREQLIKNGTRSARHAQRTGAWSRDRRHFGRRKA